MIYLVNYCYAPNTAVTNRLMAYAKGISEMEVNAKIVFFSPDILNSRYEGYLKHIDFIYLWDRFYLNFPVLYKLSLRYYLWQFVKSLNSGDTIYVYGFPDLVIELSKREDIRVFAERTEHNESSFVPHIKKATISDFLEACRKIEGVIVISQGLKDYYIKNGCQPNRVHIVNMIVDTTRFAEIEKKQSEPYIAYCGTASNNKDGVDQLIKAFSIVVKNHPEYRLYIIGSTPSKKQRFDNYELVRNLGIEDNVVFTGVISSHKIPQMLKDATVLALDRPDNQQAKYGFPTKLGEYLLTGNPVVVTRVGDIPLFLKDMESALIAEPHNPDSFADNLNWAIEHPEEAKVIGANGKKVAEESFNSTIETKKLIHILS